jgi:hypothetical protein
MQLAGSIATTRLTHKYFEEYREYYAEVKGDKQGATIRAKAQGIARRKLVAAHRTEYLLLCALAVKEGHPRTPPHRLKEKRGGK